MRKLTVGRYAFCKENLVRMGSFFIIFIISITLQGCETLKGASQGFKKDIHNLVSKEGPVHKADDWIQKHMW